MQWRQIRINSEDRIVAAWKSITTGLYHIRAKILWVIVLFLQPREAKEKFCDSFLL